MAAVNCVWRLDTQASGVTRNNKEAKDLQKLLDLMVLIMNCSAPG